MDLPPCLTSDVKLFLCQYLSFCDLCLVKISFRWSVILLFVCLEQSLFHLFCWTYLSESFGKYILHVLRYLCSISKRKAKGPILLEGPIMGLKQYLSPSPDFDTGRFLWLAMFVVQTLTNWRNIKHVQKTTLCLNYVPSTVLNLFHHRPRPHPHLQQKKYNGHDQVRG